MTIPFTNIPSNLRTPLFFAEFDNSQANTATTTQRTLIIGQMLDSSTLPADMPVLVSSVATVAGQCGAGSMLHGQMAAYLANDTAGEIYILPLSDADSMVAAVGKITVTTPASATGVITLGQGKAAGQRRGQYATNGQGLQRTAWVVTQTLCNRANIGR